MALREAHHLVGMDGSFGEPDLSRWSGNAREGVHRRETRHPRFDGHPACRDVGGDVEVAHGKATEIDSSSAAVLGFPLANIRFSGPVSAASRTAQKPRTGSVRHSHNETKT